MGEVIDKVMSTYTYVFYDLEDKRTSHFPLMDNPLLIILLVTVYLKFCTSIGPRWMKNREPFELKNTIMVYNIGQILLSVYLAWVGYCYLFSKDYNLICDPIRNQDDPVVLRAAYCTWGYLFAKITELLETIFFVLRKKTKQISTLHLYHHTMVVVTAWLATKYFPFGPIILVGTLNCSVHVFMYSYYFIASLGPKYQKYLWWKSYLTLLQLIQFVIVIAHNTSALFTNCNYPKVIHLMIIGNTSMLTYMFSKFYYNTYIKPKPKKMELTEDIKEKTFVRANRKSIRAGE